MSIETVENILSQKIANNQDFVLKFVDIGSGSGKLNSGILQAEKSDAYIQALTTKTVFLDQTKLVTSTNHKKDLDVMSFELELEAGRINGTPQTLSNSQDPNFITRSFDAEEYRALTGVHRTALKDSLEGQRLLQTITQKFGEANGRALERTLIYGNTESTASNVPTGYKVNDGIIKKLQDDGDIDQGEVDLTDTSSNPIAEVRNLIDSVPDVYKDDGGMACFCPRALTTAVRRYIADNKDVESSIAFMTKEGQVMIEDIPLVSVPAFSTPKNGFTQKPIILTHRENIQWLADPENIIVESDFNLRSNVYDIASTMYADIQFAKGDASALAFLKEA